MNDFGELAIGHFAGIGARGMENGAAGTVDCAGVVAIEWADVGVGRIRGVHVGETFPSFANTDDGAAQMSGAIDDRLDDGIKAGNVAAAGKDGDFIFSH